MLRYPQSRIVAACRQQRLEPVRELGSVAQRGDHGVSHRDRAAVACLRLRPDVELGCPGDMRSRLGARPRGRMQAMADCSCHELMPGWMEVDLVYPVAVPVVGTQHGRVLVGLPRELDNLGRAGHQAERVQFWDHPGRAVLGDSGQQRLICRDIMAGQRRDLISDLMGRAPRTRRCAGAVSGRHSTSLHRASLQWLRVRCGYRTRSWRCPPSGHCAGRHRPRRVRCRYGSRSTGIRRRRAGSPARRAH